MSKHSELLERWYADNTNRPKLEALLHDPIMIHALQIVQAFGLLPIRPEAVTGICTLTEWGAMMGFKRDGFMEALSTLEALSKTRPPKLPEVPPFDHSAQRKSAGLPEQ